MSVSRRHLLAAAALVAAGASAGAAGVAWRWWDQPADAPYALLSPDEVAILDALAEACFPAGGTPEMGGAEAGVARYFDGVLQGLAPTQRKLLKIAIHAIDALPLATHGGYLSDLPTSEASDALAGLLASPRYEIRGLAQSLTVFVGMAWFAHPTVRAMVAPHFTCGFADMGGLPARLDPPGTAAAHPHGTPDATNGATPDATNGADAAPGAPLQAPADAPPGAGTPPAADPGSATNPATPPHTPPPESP